MNTYWVKIIFRENDTTGSGTEYQIGIPRYAMSESSAIASATALFGALSNLRLKDSAGTVDVPYFQIEEAVIVTGEVTPGAVPTI